MTAGAGGTVTDGDTDALTADSNALSLMGIYSGNAFNNTVKDAADAVVYIDGIRVQNSSNTIDNMVTGLSVTVKSVSDKISSTGDPKQDLKGASLLVEQDIQKAVSAVKAFVDQYNSVMDYIKSKTGYDANNKTKGDLLGDSGVLQLQQSLRQMVGAPVPGISAAYNSLVQVGVKTTGTDANLSLDESKLTAALSDAPESIAALFGASTTNADGIAAKMYDTIKNLTQTGTGVFPGRQKSLDLQIKDIKDQMTNLESRLSLREENLRRQFNAMEQAINNFQSQGTSLTNMLNTLPSSSQK